MCQYLCSKDGPTHLSVEPGDPQYANYLNWLHFGEATLTFPQTIVLRYGRFEPDARRLPQAEDDYRRWFLARLKGLVPTLDKTDYLCGDALTAADISVGYALMLADYLQLTDRFPPVVQAYWKRLQSGAGYQRALAAQLHAAHKQGVSDTPAPLVSPIN
jgi:glutathione S-transferase